MLVIFSDDLLEEEELISRNRLQHVFIIEGIVEEATTLATGDLLG